MWAFPVVDGTTDDANGAMCTFTVVEKAAAPTPTPTPAPTPTSGDNTSIDNAITGYIFDVVIFEVVLDNGIRSRYYSLIPLVSGAYSFGTTNNTLNGSFVSVHDDDNIRFAGGDIGNGRQVTTFLHADASYYIRAYTEDEFDGGFSLIITGPSPNDNTSFDTATPITVGQTVEVDLRDYDRWYSFTPITTGKYYGVTGEGATWGHVDLYDSTEKFLTDAWSKTDSYDFPVTLTAQQTYYIHARAIYGREGTNGSFRFTIIDTPTPTATPTVSSPPADTSGSSFSGEIGGGTYFTWRKSPSALGWRLYRSATPGALGVSVTDFYITANEFFDINVDANTTYYYVVKEVFAEADPWNDKPEQLGAASAELQIRTPEHILGDDTFGKGVTKHILVMTLGDPYMTVDERRLEIDPGRGTAPLIQNSRTLVPIRAIVETIGGSVSWTESEQMVGINYNGKDVQMWLGAKFMNVNGASQDIDVAPQTINERTMLPVRFAGEAIGVVIDWLNSKNQAVVVFVD
jgi:hypothetical protein